VGFLKTEHLRSETDGDGFNRAVETTGTTVPTFIRIFHYRDLSFAIEMYDI
jgi:hypothetical protein